MIQLFKDITKKRELIDISKSSSRIVIQENDDIIVDLDKSYYKKDNIIINLI